jgi:hypothetical protein
MEIRRRAIVWGRPSAVSYPLPSDRWKPGRIELTALTGGRLHIQRLGSEACAWIGGSRPRSFVWPAGYRVTLDPAALIAPDGHVAGRAGERMGVAGGIGTGHVGSTCGTGVTWFANGHVGPSRP